MTQTMQPQRRPRLTMVGMGRMGQMIASLAPEYGFDLWLTIDQGQEALFDDPKFAESDVVIDFTHAQSAYNVCRKALDKGLPVVSGTTGWNDQLIALQDEIKRTQKGTLFYASNFSLGVNLFFALNQQLARLIAPHPVYHAEMQEKHHIQKKDAPSGTAITLAESIIKGIPQATAWHIAEAPEGSAPQNMASSTSAEGYSVPIYVTREGDHKGLHSITYRSPIDTITITHESFSREGFARGALTAARYALTHQGVLSMEKLLADLTQQA